MLFWRPMITNKKPKKLRISKALRGRLDGVVKQGRKQTLIKIICKKYNGIIPCYVCAEPVKKELATLEHILPTSLGGTDDMGNLWLSHDKCNQKRGNNIDYPCLMANKGCELTSKPKTNKKSFYEAYSNAG